MLWSELEEDGTLLDTTWIDMTPVDADQVLVTITFEVPGSS